jgi:16S rRNA (guanine527-N7)-methyltransferase
VTEVPITYPQTVNADARDRLAAFAALLLAANARFNLTGARDAAAVEAHIADALAIAGEVRDPLIDVGSGGGLPGIPLAIVTGARVTLVESAARKARFLRETIAALGIAGEVVHDRAEVAARIPELRERFASASARAVGSLPTVLELTVPFLAVGGVAVLQRGSVPEEERLAAIDAARMLGAELADEIAQLGARRVLVFRKVAATPGRFPRRCGIPEKRPLCARRGTTA